MRFFKRDSENEVSGGQVFGYILIAAAIMFAIAFGIFIVLKSTGAIN